MWEIVSQRMAKLTGFILNQKKQGSYVTGEKIKVQV